MKIKIQKRFIFLNVATALVFSFLSLSLISCGGSGSSKSEAEEKEPTEEEFYATQPVVSGLYDADYYDIKGNNPRKGKFDGRIYIALNPKFSAFNVFENGNRTKIDYFVNLKEPFEKTDSVYSTLDTKNLPVTINTDSTTYFLNFIHQNDTVCIGFNPKPRHEGTATEIAEKIAARKKK